MASIIALWLPIVLSAVLIFIASSIIHMVLKYHWGDYKPLPGEAAVGDAMRSQQIPPGDYAIPCPRTMKEMNTPEVKGKYAKGPVAFMTVLPTGAPAMGGSLIQWFVYCLAIGFVTAYITSRTVAPGAEYLQIFRVAGAVSFIGYAGAHPSASIWGKRKWSTTVKHVFDGLVYALLTAGAFAGFWPE